MRVLYDSPAAACKQFKLSLGHRDGTLTCRAHNHRKADESRWYVIPSAEWPPYAHAMFFSDWDPDKEGAIRIGALLARGLANSVYGEMTRPNGRAVVTQRHWRWREVVAEDNSELFIEPIVTAAGAAEDGKIRLEVTGTELPPTMVGDTRDGRRKWDRLLFDVDRTGAMEGVLQNYDLERYQRLEGIKDIDELAAALRNLVSEDWFFFEVLPHISVNLEKSVKGRKKPEDRLVTTHELYDKLLVPFETWLFSGEEEA